MNPLRADQCIQRYTYENFPLEQSPLKWKGIDGRIARHLVTIQKEAGLVTTIFTKSYKAAAYIALKTLLRGSPIDQGYKRYYDALESYQVFMCTRDQLTPPAFDEVLEKGRDRALTPTHYFAISDRNIWAKRRYEPDSPWEIFYFDGLVNKRIPVEIQADGCNLIVKDDLGDIHYKKAVREARNGIKYTFIDKVHKDNWKPCWYTLPYVSGLFNLFTPKRLTIGPEIQSFAISQLGRYGSYYEDAANVAHNVTTITTLYALFKGSNTIHLADPWWSAGFNNPPSWLSLGFDHTIEGPQDPEFVADEIDAAGSTILLKGTSGGVPRYYTTLADVDTMGRNILNTYTHDKSKAFPNIVRCLTPPNWVRQPNAPMGYQPLGTTHIYQSGEGNSARTLQISVRDPQGAQMYLTKNIADYAWHLDLLHSNPNK